MQSARTGVWSSTGSLGDVVVVGRAQFGGSGGCAWVRVRVRRASESQHSLSLSLSPELARVRIPSFAH